MRKLAVFLRRFCAGVSQIPRQKYLRPPQSGGDQMIQVFGNKLPIIVLVQGNGESKPSRCEANLEHYSTIATEIGFPLEQFENLK
jgi:hypothetical protein